MYFRERDHTSEKQTLDWMDSVFNEDYPKRFMVFAIGNSAKKSKIWQLLGVIRLDHTEQFELAL